MSQTLLELNALAHFAAVVEHGSFSAAARALGVSRQALHRTVGRLEEQVGVRLLDRGPRSLRPTDTGRRLRGHAQRVLDAALDASEVVRAAKDQPRGLLRIAAPPLFAQLQLGSVIREFLRRWPEVRIEADFSHMSPDLLRDDYDLAIHIRVAPPDDYIARHLGEAEMVCCASPAYLHDRPALAHPSDLLAGHDRVCFGPSVSLPDVFHRDGEQVAVLAEAPRLRVADYRVATEALVNGLGVGVVPASLCAEHVAAGRLVRLFVGWKLTPSDIWAVYSGRAQGNPTLRAFLDMLDPKARAHPVP